MELNQRRLGIQLVHRRGPVERSEGSDHDMTVQLPVATAAVPGMDSAVSLSDAALLLKV